MHRSSLPIALLLALVTFLPGCQKPLGPGALGEASAAYAAGEYRSAYQTAAQLAGDSNLPPNQRAEAAYIAGMAAHQAGQTRHAQRYLLQATGADDLSLKGNAFASLGLSYAQEERYPEAAQAMLRAAEFLHGQEKANAYYHAGLAQQKLGQHAQARTSLTLARQHHPDPAFHEQVDQQLATTGYTLQIGAFREASNAQQAAEELARKVADLRLGTPRVVPAQDPSGGSLQLVQIGQFSTFASARAAKDQLDLRDVLIVPLP